MNIEQIKQIIGYSDCKIEEVSGGLFNHVYKLNKSSVKYMKIFSDTAKSPNFPELPTTSTERCIVALEAHKIAYSSRSALILVPEILDYNLEKSYILMSGIEGEPLYNFVTNLHYSLDNLFCYTMKCIEWLKKIHCANIPRKAFIDNASDKFKKYKIDLQYNRLLNYLNETSRQNATLFIDSYINSKEQLVHGDFNSRNILLNTNTNQIGIIDFEQAHIGSGVYDVAYIASELIIRIVASQNEDKKLDEYIEKIFNSYYDDRLNLKTTFVIFSKHLFFQVLYRLVGPSKLAWSGHLNEVKKTEIIHFSITRLNELFIV